MKDIGGRNVSQPKLHGALTELGATDSKGSSPVGVRKESESSMAGAATGKDCMTSLLLFLIMT